MKKELIPGGLAQNMQPSDFPKKELEEGIKVEMEHTSDPNIAEEIAMDHLQEDLQYYKKLEEIEKASQNLAFSLSKFCHKNPHFKNISGELINNVFNCNASVEQLLSIANEVDPVDPQLAGKADQVADLLINEPRRKDPIKKEDMPDFEENGGYNNIMQLLSQATAEEIDFWGKWYHNAHEHVQALASKYNYPFDVTAAIVATLSPGNTWKSNLNAAEKLFREETSINAYPAQAKKAKDIMITGNTSLVTGPKVTVFFRTLLNPDEVDKEMVLDGHAINIWRGNKAPLNQLSSPGNKQREQMVADYNRAAADTGLSVSAVQAITWYLWKSTHL